MSEFNTNDIKDAKRRVEEMRKKAHDYVESYDKSSDPKVKDSSLPNSFLSDITGSILSTSSNEKSQGLILALILILSKEGADNELILALLYILL